MNFKRNNGGNIHGVNDCVARAIAITLKRPYAHVAQELAAFTQEGGVNVWAAGFVAYMEAQGFRYVEGLTRVKVAELPTNCIAHTLNHYTAIVDGCVQDLVDTRLEMVRGYWVQGARFNVVAKGTAKNSAPMNFEQALNMRRLLALNHHTRTEIQTIC